MNSVKRQLVPLVDQEVLPAALVLAIASHQGTLDLIVGTIFVRIKLSTTACTQSPRANASSLGEVLAWTDAPPFKNPNTLLSESSRATC